MTVAPPAVPKAFSMPPQAVASQCALTAFAVRPDDVGAHWLAGHNDDLFVALPAQIGDFKALKIVAKSFSGKLTSAKRALFTTAVNYVSIDRTLPWFLQTEVGARDDVTIVVCGYDFYAFTRSRKDLEGLDWRRAIGEDSPETSNWRMRLLSNAEQKSLRGPCRELINSGGHYAALHQLQAGIHEVA